MIRIYMVVMLLLIAGCGADDAREPSEAEGSAAAPATGTTRDVADTVMARDTLQ